MKIDIVLATTPRHVTEVAIDRKVPKGKASGDKIDLG